MTDQFACEAVVDTNFEVACLTCGAAVPQKRRRRGRHARFCSAKCGRDRHNQLMRNEYHARKEAAGPAWEPRPKIHSRACVVCGNPFSTYDSRTKCCSTTCGQALSVPHLKAGHAAVQARRIFATRADKDRTHCQRRRARARAAPVEVFQDVEIFRRDRWRCGLCGDPVDRRLKYPAPMSASLDHIVPLSKGGHHTRANSQCSHLTCNVRKQAGGGGQLRLFG